MTGSGKAYKSCLDRETRNGASKQQAENTCAKKHANKEPFVYSFRKQVDRLVPAMAGKPTSLVPVGSVLSSPTRLNASEDPKSWRTLLKEMGGATTASMSTNSGGAGWKWRTGQLGSGAVMRPDYKVCAKQWAKGWLRNGRPSPEHKASWEEFARRMQMFPEDIPKGWNYLRGGELGEAVRDLKSIMGEATSWWGYSVPNLHMFRTPQVGAPGFGFRTKAAERVWDFAKKICDEDPKQQTKTIVAKATDQAGVLVTELTPEDGAMLDMAISWYLSGKIAGAAVGAPNRIGGTPGGPFRSVGYGHHLGSKGAP